MARFHNDEISVDTKRQLIAEENEFFHGDHVAALTRARTLVTSPADDEPEGFWWQRD